MRGLESHPALEVVQHLPRRRGSRIGQCAVLRRRDDLARAGENHEGRNAAVDGTAVPLRHVQILVPISHVDVHHVEISIQEGMHRLVLVQMRQDDAVEAPVGAKVEQDELAVGLSLGQCRLNVLVGVRALVVWALRARRGVRAKGECQEGGQREPLHTGLHGPTGIWEVYTARALQGFECCFREREGDRVPGLEDREELGRHTPGYFPRKSRRNPTVSIVPWAMTDTQRLRPVTKYKSPNTKPPNPAVIMPESP